MILATGPPPSGPPRGLLNIAEGGPGVEGPGGQLARVFGRLDPPRLRRVLGHLQPAATLDRMMRGWRLVRQPPMPPGRVTTLGPGNIGLSREPLSP